MIVSLTKAIEEAETAMLKSLLTTTLATVLATGAVAQGLILDNLGNAGGFGARTGGRVWTDLDGAGGAGPALFDGINYNLGVEVFGGPTSDNLVPMGRFTAATDPKGYNGADLGQFQLGAEFATVNVPGVTPGGTAWIQLQIWYDGAGGLFPNFEAAAYGSTSQGFVLFPNPTSNAFANPPVPAMHLVGMPSILLGCLGCLPAHFLQQPESLTVVRGDSATFTVVASGAPSTTYQWQFKGNNIAGATGSALVLTNAQVTNAGTYSVTTRSWEGVLNQSANVILTVLVPPTIFGQQANGEYFEFSFDTQPSHTYEIQCSDSLLPDSWQAVTNFTALGSVATIPVSMTSTQRFYRIKTQY